MWTTLNNGKQKQWVNKYFPLPLPDETREAASLKGTRKTSQFLPDAHFLFPLPLHSQEFFRNRQPCDFVLSHAASRSLRIRSGNARFVPLRCPKVLRAQLNPAREGSALTNSTRQPWLICFLACAVPASEPLCGRKVKKSSSPVSV